MTDPTAAAPNIAAQLVATTQVIEKLVSYIPKLAMLAPALTLIPGVGPEVAAGLAVAGKVEPIAEAGLKMIEDIETAGASGSPFAIFAAVEKHAGDIAALAAQIKQQFPAAHIPDLSHLPGMLPAPAPAAAPPGVSPAQQASNDFQAPT